MEQLEIDIRYLRIIQGRLEATIDEISNEARHEFIDAAHLAIGEAMERMEVLLKELGRKP